MCSNGSKSAGVLLKTGGLKTRLFPTLIGGRAADM
jgi:hypothetical protein